ncbi:hypothetical protein JOF53_000835 [Crossiella equi]|uniref:Uncharacterized protein n=1 Tax=Crossiella equi TaxID=130796 RepID=A0ABS5A5U2_9PSEU|nr:hypothetical protein [Crossiella equi]MBP2471963.1 hypothetical protein [Crossiella equi]
MSDGFVRLYQHGWNADRAEQRVASLDRSGLRLGHPATGRITALNEDGQVELHRDALLAELAKADGDDGLLFQYWLHDAEDEDTDVACIVAAEAPGLVSEDFAVDGLGREEQDRVFRLVAAEFRDTEDDKVALIVDRRGVTAEVDWLQVLLGTAKLDSLPTALALPADVVERHPELARVPFQAQDDFLVHDPEGLLG